MLRPTGRLVISAAIVLFFAGMMSSLLYFEVLRPQWSPQYRSQPIDQPKEFWLGVYSGEQRVGFFNARVSPRTEDGERGVGYRGMLKLNLPLFGKLADLAIQGEGFRENRSGKTTFDVSLRSAEQNFRAEGVLENGQLDARVHTGDEVIPFKYQIGDDMLLSGGMSGLDLPPLRPGEEIYADAFNPVSMKRDKARIRCTGQETIPVLGVDTLTNVLETELGAIKSTAWVDQSQEVVKVVTPFGFTLKKIDPREAYSPEDPDDQADLIRNLAVKVEGQPPVRGATEMQFRMTGIAPEAMPPSEVLQTLTGDTYRIEVGLPPKDGGAPLDEDSLKEFLASDMLVNADHATIRKASADIVMEAEAPWGKASRIYHWVYENIEKMSVLSVPSSLEVLRTRQGDCNEHTVLYTALARAAGVPTRIAIGLVYSEDLGGFGYHAWPEVYAGAWIPVDPTLGQPIADATHIKLLNGGIDQWPRLVAYIGQAKIEVLSSRSDGEFVEEK